MVGFYLLRLMYEMMVMVLVYGIYKMDLLDMELLNVVFVDIGYVSM